MAAVVGVAVVAGVGLVEAGWRSGAVRASLSAIRVSRVYCRRRSGKFLDR